jgi:exopolyphosphatase/guanosine-5'-triphosphate,3'-diphosphate pyrophosphatase
MAEPSAEYATLAAVDLGSNSFHCQIARVVGDQIYPLDALREPVRLGAGLNADKLLDESVQERALICLQRFGERLRGSDRQSVRAVGTNTLRVAKNAPAFLKRAQAALGFPIEVIAGREEARLIYLGVQHSLPSSKDKRLIVDIGGGSTELIIGSGYDPLKLASLYMGCVSYSLRFFPEGKITKPAMKKAELAARNELQPIASDYSRKQWQQAVGSSGTIRALAEIAQLNGFGDGRITAAALEKLRASFIKAGDITRLELSGVRPDRGPVLPGGLAILSAVFAALGISEMAAAPGAMREGLLYDLLGRVHHKDMRDVTVAQFMKRYHVDAAQAHRVGALAQSLYAKLIPDERNPDSTAATYLGWAAKLHEIGISVAYNGYHKHSAYILEKADMPGFSRDEQAQLSFLVLAHRRSLRKVQARLDQDNLKSVLALRLAALFYRGRSDVSLPDIDAKTQSRQCRLNIDSGWLARNPLTAAALYEEVSEWDKASFELRIPALEDFEGLAEAASVQ